ncbi:MAG: OmpH family outer membrane protein [Prevotellaceae bacterium]|nr:OmpH family outer membrane protein [Prevotellaceae bacterium]
MKKAILLFSIIALPLTVSAQELKFGYISAQEVMMEMPEINAIEKEIADFNAQNTKYMQDMQKEIEDKAAKYEKERATLSESIRKVQEEDLQILYQRYQNAQQTLYTEMQDKQAKLLQPVQERLKKAIEAVGKKNNFFFVFNLDEGGVVYKSEKAIDITALVKKELGIL